MLNKLKTYIAKHKLLGNGKYIVALSGGADSVCLLRVMLSMGYNIEAAHCNFRLRGDESNRDEEFCTNLCARLDVPLHKVHFDTREYASLHKVSIEMAARELRYAYFEQLRLAIGADGIVVAHHSDDNVETILLNLVRGTGIYGLEGIKPRNGFILRPLLCLSKNEILDYLSSVNQDFITDSSNLVDDVQRNKIRLNLMPILRSVNPSASENILTTAENISQAARVYSHAINESVNECFDGKALDITKLLQQPSPEAVLYEVLKTFDFSSGTVRQIFDNLSAPSGKTWSNDTYTVAMDRGTLFIGKSYSETPPLVIPEEGLYRIAGDVSNIKVEVAPLTAETIISKEPFIATLDADKVAFPLTLRLVQTGDRFVPFGMKGSKLISDYLTDKKKNYFQRKAQLVVADATDKIVWLIGERVSAEASVGPDTIKILTLRYSKE